MAAKTRKTAAAVAAVEARVFDYIETRMIDPNALKVAKLPTDPFFDPTDRHELAVDPDMLVSILTRGVVQPIVAARHGDDLWIIDGRQRAATAIAARRATVPVTVYDIRGYSKLEVERLILEMNTLKQGVEAIKASKVAKQWIDSGLSRKAAAASMHITESAFDAFLAIANAPEVVKDAVVNNIISPSAVPYLSTVPEVAAKQIDRAVEIRAEINAANPGKAGKLTKKVSNLDVRAAVAEDEDKTLPESAVRATDAKPEKAKGPRTGPLNAKELGDLIDALSNLAPTVATDKTASKAIMAAVEALRYAQTGNAAPLADCAPLKGLAIPARA